MSGDFAAQFEKVSDRVIQGIRKSKIGFLKMLFRTIGIASIIIGFIVFFIFQFFIAGIAKFFGIALISSIFSIVFNSIVFGVFLIIGIFSIIISERFSKQQQELELVAGIIHAYRRIKITDISEKSGIPVFKIHKIIAKALDLKIIEGNFDRTTDEFFTDESLEEKVNIQYCKSCGAPFDREYYKGETITCSSCGSVVKVD